jgi:Trk-type K+ transport system membrane component
MRVRPERENTMPLQQEKAKRKRRSLHHKQRVQALWITIIFLGVLIIGGGLLIASTDNYNWLFK